MKKKSIYDNPAMIMIGNIADMTFVYFLWIICCLPIVTIGASTSALYSVMLKMGSKEPYHVWTDFKASLCTNFKTRILLWLGMFAVYAFLLMDLGICILNPMPILNVVFYLILGCLCIFHLLAIYIFPVQGRYCGSFRDTVLRSITCSTTHFLTLLIAFLPLIPFIVFHFTMNKYVIAFILVVGFPVLVFLQAFCLSYVLRRYERNL